MERDPIPISAEHLLTLQSAPKPLFELGRVLATPAVLEHLSASRVFPTALLQPHQHGDWGQLHGKDAESNDAAVLSGGRIVSVYLVEGERVFAITAAADDDGVRASTVLCFAAEY